MTEDTEREDRVILAFTPSDADYATDGHRWSLYNPSLDNPYTVDDTDEKINAAKERLDPDEYSLRGRERWIRLDWRSVMDGDPERILVEASRVE